MIDMKLTRQYFDVKDVRFGDTCSFAAGILTVSEKELQALTADLFKAVGGFHLEITHPGENARILPPWSRWKGRAYSIPAFSARPTR